LTHKICPICGTPAHPNAALCSACGASLQAVRQVVENGTSENPDTPPEYDHHYGETDLFERNLSWRGGTYLVGGMLVVAMIICAAMVFLAGTQIYTVIFEVATPTPETIQAVPADSANPAILSTNTPRPTIVLNTVTPAPTVTDTPPPTETLGPCMIEVQPGDTMIAVVGRCGHRHLAVIDVVLQLNNLDAPELLRSGQMLEVPWPTPTPDPDAQPAEEGAPEGEGAAAVVASVPTNPLSGLPIPPTATLQPGVTWHRVVRGENIIVIAYQYGANVKILSELNPEITFSQCDFGLETGGAQCVVNLYEGQNVRVPAPTPTPTLSPTPSGSETPTPTPTATFNAPSARSPADRTHFRRDEIVTLRWSASGTLAPDQVYSVRVEDLTANVIYTGETTDLFFIIPGEWQGNIDRRHEYRWAVSVIDRDKPNQPYFTTEALTFVWEAMAERNSDA
jgi:hypothetical protein